MSTTSANCLTQYVSFPTKEIHLGSPIRTKHRRKPTTTTTTMTTTTLLSTSWNVFSGTKKRRLFFFFLYSILSRKSGIGVRKSFASKRHSSFSRRRRGRRPATTSFLNHVEQATTPTTTTRFIAIKLDFFVYAGVSRLLTGPVFACVFHVGFNAFGVGSVLSKAQPRMPYLQSLI